MCLQQFSCDFGEGGDSVFDQVVRACCTFSLNRVLSTIDIGFVPRLFQKHFHYVYPLHDIPEHNSWEFLLCNANHAV